MKILFVSLGCDKNLVDSEHMLAMLRREGFELTDDEAEAEFSSAEQFKSEGPPAGLTAGEQILPPRAASGH